MPTVSLDRLEDAVEWVSTDLMVHEAYICRQTGKIYWIAGDPGMIDEEEEIPSLKETMDYVQINSRCQAVLI